MDRDELINIMFSMSEYRKHILNYLENDFRNNYHESVDKSEELTKHMRVVNFKDFEWGSNVNIEMIADKLINMIKKNYFPNLKGFIRRMIEKGEFESYDEVYTLNNSEKEYLEKIFGKFI